MSDGSNASILADKKWKIENHHEIFLKLQQQRNNDEFCDVVLQVEDQEFPAHRSILAAFSEYFLKMFTVDMKEKHCKNIEIKDVTAEAVKEILNGIYTGEVCFTEDRLKEILQAATLMQVICILDVAERFMLNRLDCVNCSFFHELATTYSFKELKSTIVLYILFNFDAVSEEESLLDLHFDEIDQILQSELLVTSREESVFEFILKWVHKDLERQQYFLQLFKHIRLQFIPIKYVVDTIGKHGLVKELNECRDAVLDAVSYYITPTVSASEKPRKCFASKPDSFMIIPYQERCQFVYNLQTKEIKKISFKGFTQQTILRNCAVASKHPVAVLCGGCTSGNISSNKVVRFDGSRWFNLPPMNISRCGGAAVLHNDKLYVFGGEICPISNAAQFSRGQSNPDASNFARSFEVFEEERWEETECEQEQRSYGAATVYKNEIFLIGGYKPESSEFNAQETWKSCKVSRKDVVIYDVAAGAWKESDQLNEARAEFGCSWYNSNIFVVGGYGAGGRDLGNAEFKNMTQNSVWTVISGISFRNRFDPSSTHSCCIGNQMLVCRGNRNYVVSFDKNCKTSEDNSSFPTKGVLLPFANRYIIHPLHQILRFK